MDIEQSKTTTMDREFLQTPKLVTLRNLEKYSLDIQKAMKHYDTSVASNVFIQSMIDAPNLADELRDLRRAFRKLQDEHYELKASIESYFDSQNRLKKLADI